MPHHVNTSVWCHSSTLFSRGPSGSYSKDKTDGHARRDDITTNGKTVDYNYPNSTDITFLVANISSVLYTLTQFMTYFARDFDHLQANKN